MLDENKIRQARDIFLKNEYWRRLYEGLTPGAKRWYDLEFTFSDAEKVGADKDNAADELHAYESQMSYDDLCCLLVHETNGYMRNKLKKLIVVAAER